MWEYIIIIIVIIIIVVVGIWLFSGTSTTIGPPSMIEVTRDRISIITKWAPVLGAKAYNVYLSETPTGIGDRFSTLFNGLNIPVPNPCKKYYVSVTTYADGLESKRSKVIEVPTIRPEGPKIEAAVRRENIVTIVLFGPHNGTYKVIAGPSKNNLNLVGIPQQGGYSFTINVSSIPVGNPVYVKVTDTNIFGCESLPTETIVR